MNFCKPSIELSYICKNFYVASKNIIQYISLTGSIVFSKIYLESEWETYGLWRFRFLQIIMLNMLSNLD